MEVARGRSTSASIAPRVLQGLRTTPMAAARFDARALEQIDERDTESATSGAGR